MQPDSIVTTDAQGMPTAKTVFSGDDKLFYRWNATASQWVFSYKEHYTALYDDEGRTTFTEYSEHDASGRMTAGVRSEYTYLIDSDQQTLVLTDIQRWDATDGLWRDSTQTQTEIITDSCLYERDEEDIQTLYIYQDSTLRYTLTTYLSPDGTEAAFITQEFDNQGNQLSALSQLYTYDNNDNLQTDTQKTITPTHSLLVNTQYSPLNTQHSTLPTPHSPLPLPTLRDTYTQSQDSWQLLSRDTYYYPSIDTAIHNPHQNPNSPLNSQHSPLPTPLYTPTGQRITNPHPHSIIITPQGLKILLK